MAANPDFKKIVLKDVHLLWPRLDQTYRFNNAEKRTEACDPKVQGAEWSTSFKLDMNAAKKLKSELKAHYEECQSRNSKLPAFKKVFGSKVLEDEDGNKTDEVRFSARKKAIANSGKANKQPTVVGPDLQPCNAEGLWSGTIANIRMLAVPTTDPDGDGGITLLLDAVQIIEAVEGGDNLEDDFGPAKTPDFETMGEETNKAAKQPAMSDEEF